MNALNNDRLYDELRKEWVGIVHAVNEQVLGDWTTALDAMLEEEADLRAQGKWVRGAAGQSERA